jgi:hypothetical protein
MSCAEVRPLAEEHMGLPSGRPAREAMKGGDPGGFWEKRSIRTFKKECVPILGGTFSGKPLLITY